MPPLEPELLDELELLEDEELELEELHDEELELLDELDEEFEELLDDELELLDDELVELLLVDDEVELLPEPTQAGAIKLPS
jgi:hypothetical protein